MKITISTGSPMAIYEQIVSQIKDAVIQKELVPGSAMPSIRGLAKELSVSVITTKRAYEELEKEGVIHSIAGKGFYVSEMDEVSLKEKQTIQLESHFEQLVQDAKNAGLRLEEIVDLVTVLYEND